MPVKTRGAAIADLRSTVPASHRADGAHPGRRRDVRADRFATARERAKIFRVCRLIMLRFSDGTVTVSVLDAWGDALSLNTLLAETNKKPVRRKNTVAGSKYNPSLNTYPQPKSQDSGGSAERRSVLALAGGCRWVSRLRSIRIEEIIGAIVTSDRRAGDWSGERERVLMRSGGSG
jgi:hypothetical protein